MGYLRWPTLVISAVAPLDVSHGLEWAMGTGPWGGGNRSRSQHRPSGPGARNSNPPGRKKYKCVQVKLIELGLCLEIAIDTFESTFSIPSGVATARPEVYLFAKDAVSSSKVGRRRISSAKIPSDIDLAVVLIQFIRASWLKTASSPLNFVQSTVNSALDRLTEGFAFADDF
ncbi:hypothetical protein ACFE04_025399 [Oxalis oulophora]